MGAPLGNQNAARAKLWQAAIERATARLATGAELDPNDDRSDFVKGIDMMADDFVKQRNGKDPMPFFKEYGDRLDGKAHQSIDATVDGNLTVELVKFSGAPGADQDPR